VQTDLKYILTIINSSLLSYYFVLNTAKSVRKMFPKIILKDLRQFPIKRISLGDQQPFIEKADLMLDLNEQQQTEKSNFLNTLKEEKGIQKISKKTDAFYDLEYDEFKKELRKKKIKIQLGNENNEWREYFNTSKQKIKEIQSLINNTDQEIDLMVYELYGLTLEEIKIVENAA